MLLKDILSDMDIPIGPKEAGLHINGISVNSDESKHGDLFILYSPSQNAVFNENNSPSAILTDEKAIIVSNAPVIRAPDLRAATAFACYRFYKPDFNGMTLIGITGTNGKTTTALMLFRILMDAGLRVGLIGTGRIEINGEALHSDYYSMTTPDPWLLYKMLRKMSDEGCNAVIMEASSHSLALSKLSPLTFDYGVFTNLTPEHRDFHKSEKDYYNAKAKLFRQSKAAVFNLDDPYAEMASKDFQGKKITVGALKRGDVYATEIRDEGFNGSSFLYYAKSFRFLTHLKLPGIYNVYNAMIAAAVAIDIGVKPYQVKESLCNIKTIPGRYEIIRGEVTVIIDYAHTKEAFEGILRSVKGTIQNKGRLTVIFGCGGEREKEKRPQMAAAAENYADEIIVTNDNPRGEEPEEIIKDILKGFKEKKHRVVIDRAEAIREAIANATDNEVIAIIGKGEERYSIGKSGYNNFCDKKIIEEALSERKKT